MGVEGLVELGHINDGLAGGGHGWGRYRIIGG